MSNYVLVWVSKGFFDPRGNPSVSNTSERQWGANWLNCLGGIDKIGSGNQQISRGKENNKLLLTAVVVFVLAIFAVFMIITHPALRDALAALAALELVRAAPLRHAWNRHNIISGLKYFHVNFNYFCPESAVNILSPPGVLIKVPFDYAYCIVMLPCYVGCRSVSLLKKVRFTNIYEIKLI